MAHDNGGEDRLAPVIPLFGSRTSEAKAAKPAEMPSRPGPGALWSSALAEGSTPRSTSPAGEAHRENGGAADDLDEVRTRAEEVLVRKLRAKQLSVAEARTVLRSNEVDRDTIEQILDEFLHRGYLDDRTLASLLVSAGVERKGQGRVALSRALSQRGLSRTAIDEALAELPDDDEDRALEYARSKATSMSRLEPEVALRRLLGQLARRGYGGSAAMNAARTALREAGGHRSNGRSGVRFIDSD